MSRIFISPSKYVQGSGEFENLGKYTKDLGHKALLILSESSFERNQEAIEKAYEIDDVAYVTDFFNGECNWPRVFRN